jgi:uncharacterized protein (UPF0276 family)
MGAGGPAHVQLTAIRERFPLSIHGVGLSIGSSGPLNRDHLTRLKRLCDRYKPASFSEHLAWSTHDGVYLSDLLPLPYTGETFDIVATHIEQVQDALGRQMLLENPSVYLTFKENELSEAEFLAGLVRRTGCGLLLDLNNVFVTAVNSGTCADDYLAAYPLGAVKEIHLAGHSVTADDDGAPLLIDAHGSHITGAVWALYNRVIAETGPMATLVEWDNNVPEWRVLFAETQKAENILRSTKAAAPTHMPECAYV